MFIWILTRRIVWSESKSLLNNNRQPQAPFGETEPFDSPCQDYASNVSDSPKPLNQPGREVGGFQLAPFPPFATWNPPPSPPGELKALRKGKGRIGGVNIVFRWRGVGEYQTVHHSLSAAARGGAAMRRASLFFILAALVDRSCTEEVFKQPGVRAGGLKPAPPDPQEPLEMSQPAIGLPPGAFPL